MEPFCQGCHEDWCDTAFVACAFVTAACVTEATVLAVTESTAAMASARATAVALPHHPDDPPPREYNEG